MIDLITYEASRTLSKFHKDNNFVRALIGPFGSGKSVACVSELLRRSCNQQPDDRGLRRTKWVIIRNTYRELLDTTMATFFNWIPKESGKMNMSSMVFELITPLADGTTLHAIFLFRALDRPADIRKLLSLDITGAWVNECREVPLQVINMAESRCGRYPETILDPDDDRYLYDPANCRALFEPTWVGIIMDTNAPDTDSWFYNLFEVNRPDNHSIYHQPSGIAPNAENIRHLPRNYYTNMMAGKTKEWVDVYIHGKYGFVKDGKSIYPEYNDDTHYVDEEFTPDNRLVVYIGIDFGLTPAALIGQKTSSGAMVIFDELVTYDMGAVSFGKLLRQKLATPVYRGCEFEIYGDPSGDSRAQTDEQTPFMILRQAGLDAFPCVTNDPVIRREVVVDYLLRLDFTAKPAFRITRGAPTFRKAMAGGYKYRRLQVAGEERYMDKPDKNKYSHVAEAGQYLFLGAVGDSHVVGGFSNKEIDYSVINRRVV